MDRETVWVEVKKNIAEVLPSVNVDEIKPGDRLVELGANSVDRVEIITLTLEGLNLHVRAHELAGVENIGGLVELLHQKALE
ncbi:MAG TPA: acyl carrier protein [Pyrinomonadaceae bacterium]